MGIKKGNSMGNIETTRLLLRPVVAQDLEDIYEYSSHPEVGPNAGWKPHESKEESRQFMEEIFIGQECVWGIIWKEEQKLIGTVGLIEDDKRVSESIRMIGYSIGRAYWGKGIMTEAAKAVNQYGFDKQGLELITAYCYPSNPRSRSVIEKCGMQYEGRLRMAETLYDGRVMDHLCFSLTKEEYLK